MQNYNFSKFDPNDRDINMTNSNLLSSNASIVSISNDTAYSSKLVILEQPVEMFRFRYKSEMYGTHGSLYGDRSEKTKKTFPEVELKNFNCTGIIRCSLYQTHMDKPSLHSHQLVVHKDDIDEYDPHDVIVSPEKGYIARFENMSIIHTPRKDILKELLIKKIMKLKNELQCQELSQKQEKALRVEAERETKIMNLNQVRLCFEAYKIVDEGYLVKICEPVFSRPISNRKSALTGELKICRLSITVGSAAGGDDLILLVEKVNKNKIKVRFFETVNDEEVWEAFGYFTEADVHHQYAIAVRTPAYRDKEIENHINVFIELVRETDNERSFPVTFRYKPRDIVLSRKRRRNAYSMTSNPLNSHELSESLPQKIESTQPKLPIIRQELNREAEIIALYDTNSTNQNQLNSFMQQGSDNSDELQILRESENSLFMYDLTTDGEESLNMKQKQNLPRNRALNPKQNNQLHQYNVTMKLLLSAFNERSKLGFKKVMKKCITVFEDYTAFSENGDSILHDIIKQGNKSDAIMVLKILSKLNLTKLLMQKNNFGHTPLHVACIFDQPFIIRPLLALKCDPNVQDTCGNTALHIAIAENLKQCLESFVLHSELNVNLTNDDGLVPLHLAIRANNVDFVKVLLVKCNASTKIANSRDGNNALHLAVQQHNKEIVSIILEYSVVKVLANARNRAGHTAIDLAKNLAGHMGTEILDKLHAYLPNSVAKLPSSSTAKVIKEEPDFYDSYSSTGDEDDKSSLISLEIKEENEEIHLKHMLKDEMICNRLGALLNVNDKWKRIGSHLKLDHLLFMWASAEAMLKYVIEVDDIKALTLLNALKLVDKEAASMVTSLLTTYIDNCHVPFIYI